MLLRGWKKYEKVDIAPIILLNDCYVVWLRV